MWDHTPSVETELARGSPGTARGHLRGGHLARERRLLHRVQLSNVLRVVRTAGSKHLRWEVRVSDEGRADLVATRKVPRILVELPVRTYVYADLPDKWLISEVHRSERMTLGPMDHWTRTHLRRP